MFGATAATRVSAGRGCGCAAGAGVAAGSVEHPDGEPGARGARHQRTVQDAGGAVRAVMQAVGVRDVRTKVLGSTNPHNVVRATFDALLRMKDPMELARLRGKQVEEM